jgi:hypothetical protein
MRRPLRGQPGGGVHDAVAQVSERRGRVRDAAVGLWSIGIRIDS